MNSIMRRIRWIHWFMYWMNSFVRRIHQSFFPAKTRRRQMAAKKQKAKNNGRHSQNQKADKCRQKKKKLKIMVSVLLVAAPKLPINLKLVVYLHWFLCQKKKKLKIMVSVLLVAVPKLPINYKLVVYLHWFLRELTVHHSFLYGRLRLCFCWRQ